MAKLNDARRSLHKARQSALERLKQLEDERCDIKSSLKSLDAALRVLGDADSKRKQKQPPTSAELSSALEETLQALGPIAFDDLRKAVSRKLADQGKSSANLKSQLQNELADPRFPLREGMYHFEPTS